MASLAESSIASVPLVELTRLQKHFLQHHEAQPFASHARQSDGQYVNSAAPLHVTQIEDSIDRTSSRSNPALAPRRPSLHVARSATQAEMEIMAQAAPPPREVLGALTRATTFHGYPGGDTQPMESQVYRDYRDTVAGPTAVQITPQKTKTVVQISPDGKIDTYDPAAETGDKSPTTYQEGQSGYVDLANAWPCASPGEHATSEMAEELLATPSTQFQGAGEGLTGPVVQTPALAGRKHGRDGTIISSRSTVKKTPGFSQFFPGVQQGAMLSATQLFNQTQAPTSPARFDLRSDPVVTRPSPDQLQHFSVSSPTATFSSPFETTHQRRTSLITAGVPRDQYTSMRESQERRAVKLREEHGVSKRFSDAVSDIDEGDEGEQAQAATRRPPYAQIGRVKSDDLLHWTGMRKTAEAAGRPMSSPVALTAIDLTTPAPAHRAGATDFDVSDDGHGSAGDEAILPEDDEHRDEGQMSDDEYDELGQAILRSQPEPDMDEDEEGEDGEDGNKYDDGDPQAIRPFRVDIVESPFADQDATRRTTQHSAIADSQPNPSSRYRSLLSQPQEAPSSSFVVPGSQYAGRTSQDQARATRLPSQLPPEDPDTILRIASSPPLPAANMSTSDVEINNAPEPENDVDEARNNSESRRIRAAEELPESDDLASSESRSLPPTTRAFVTESNSALLFSTARTHVSASDQSSQKRTVGSDRSPFKRIASQRSKSDYESPRKAAGVRKFSEIAASASPPRASGDTDVDVYAIMGDIITADDEEFIAAMSSPRASRAQKRQRTERVTARSMSPTKDRQQASSRMSTAQSHSVHLNDVVAVVEQELPKVEPKAGRNAARTLRDSPSKANERPPATPTNDGVPTGTPESVKAREHAGAQAASRLLSVRLSGAVKRRSGPKRKRQQAKAQNSAKPRQVRNPRQLEPEQPAVQPAEQHARSFDRGPQEQVEQAAIPIPPPVAAAPSPMVALERVFALFKGNYNMFYAATWLSQSAESKHSVRFDDGTVTQVEAHQVRRLELRVGDSVKILWDQMRTKTYVIDGFGNDTQHEPSDLVDIFGHTTARVYIKPPRNSAAGDKQLSSDEKAVVEVPISVIYLTNAMWSQFRDRLFDSPASAKAIGDRETTPLNGSQTPIVRTPGSRSRRRMIPTAKHLDARTAVLRDESVASSRSLQEHKLFSGMAFAISYLTNEAEKVEVTRLIRRNGGNVLEDGFDELFVMPNMDDASPPTPTKSLPRSRPLRDASESTLTLRSMYQGLGFVALIADRHSRRAKYMQALALGIPTLSGRWIIDCLDVSKNSTLATRELEPLPWTKYLLPAGESSYLGGAIRSRTLSPSDTPNKPLAQVLEQREILLNGEGVLIIASKKTKTISQRERTYAFLTIALGAGHVRRVADVQDARALVTEHPEQWKWVYVDGSIADAAQALLDRSASGGKKRKRAGLMSTIDAKAMSTTDGQVKVVNDEFVVQSLILGALIE